MVTMVPVMIGSRPTDVRTICIQANSCDLKYAPMLLIITLGTTKTKPCVVSLIYGA